MAKLIPSEKAAMVLSVLDDDTAVDIIKQMSDTEVGIITEEISRLKDVDDMQMAKILVEFAEEMEGSSSFDDLKDVLKRALGGRKSDEILALINPTEARPFSNLVNLGAEQLLYILSGENPQTIALVLYFVSPEKASAIFNKISSKIRGEVIMRMATMDLPPKSLLMKISLLIEAKAKKTEVRQETPKEVRLKTIADIIGGMDRTMEKSITDFIEKRDPELSTEIRKRLFVFEDLIAVTDDGLRKAMSGMDALEIALALKTADMDVRNKLLNNLSKRVKDAVDEEIEAMGPKKLSEVEGAQQKIVDIIKQIDVSEGPIIMRGDEASEQLV
ncbi:MAG: flagellar motor switch protein FliG [Candidatus Anammoxibacter sp.]